MKTPRLSLRFLLHILVAFCCCSLMAQQTNQSASQRNDAGQNPQRPTVILISIDGFRYDYPEKAKTPAIHQLIANGVRAAGLLSQFPTLTFPNHYAIVTGLLPEHNGIVANTMYDPAIPGVFKMSDHAQVTDSRWWGGEPIWVTAEKTGLKTGTVFWPGSEAEIEGVRPSYWLPFDKAKSNHDRVKQILDWLDLPVTNRPVLLTLYFNEVDEAGHDFGPNSAEVKKAIEHVDAAIGELMQGLRERQMKDEADVVIVSDHGMAETSCQRVINLISILGQKQVKIGEQGAVLTLYAEAATEKDLLNRLATVPHLTTFRKEDTPLRWNYRTNTRIGNIVAVADEGWTVRTQPPSDKQQRCIGGKHGYDNLNQEMEGVFIAQGPAFRPGTAIPAFDNLAIYDLLAHLLKIQPAKTDGSMAPIQRALQEGTADR